MGHAIFEQRSGIYGIAVASPCGVVSAGQLVALGEVAKKITVHGMKLTTRQTIVFLINKEDLAVFQEEIAKTGLRIGVFGNVVRNVKGCAGSDSLCQRFIGDAYGLGVKLQDQFMNQPTPKDFKISTAGCMRGCTDPYCADFGVVASAKDAFSIYIGGRGGSRVPQHGRKILDDVAGERVPLVLEYILNQYRELAAPEERLCRVIDRCGIEAFIPPAELCYDSAATEELDDFSAFLEGK